MQFFSVFVNGSYEKKYYYDISNIKNTNSFCVYVVIGVKYVYFKTYLVARFDMESSQHNQSGQDRTSRAGQAREQLELMKLFVNWWCGCSTYQHSGSLSYFNSKPATYIVISASAKVFYLKRT